MHQPKKYKHMSRGKIWWHLPTDCQLRKHRKGMYKCQSRRTVVGKVAKHLQRVWERILVQLRILRASIGGIGAGHGDHGAKILTYKPK